MGLNFSFQHPTNGVLEVRPISQDELSELVAIELRSHLTPWNHANFLSSLNNRHIVLGLFSSQQVMLGYTIISIVAGEAELLLFVIDCPYQGQKLGSAFLGALLKQLATKANAIFLEVRAGNIPAISLYEKLGFNQVGERSNYYSTPWGKEDALVYALEWGSSGFSL
jgi:ribosomal-protein-alanine N-acetyltransferase